MHSVATNGSKRGFPKWLVPAIGYAVSIGCLIWVYRGFSWAEEWPRIRETEWYWILAAALCDVAVYCIQGWRWNVLLSPVGRIPVRRTMQAIYIGLFANEVLPFRPGEVIRGFLQARWSGVPVPIVLSSIVIERLFDGIWLILGFFAASLFVQLPGWLLIASRFLCAVLVTIASVMVYAIFRKEDPAKVRAPWLAKLDHLVHGLRLMGTSPSFYMAFFISLVYLLLQIGPIYFLSWGFDLYLPVGTCAIILVILRIGSIPPQAPGNVGSFQLVTIHALKLFGVAHAAATGYATLLFFVITVPLWIVGFFALLATKMKLSDIHDDARAPAKVP
jgi:uncharacterized protein (TIRG00374 family)